MELERQFLVGFLQVGLGRRLRNSEDLVKVAAILYPMKRNSQLKQRREKKRTVKQKDALAHGLDLFGGRLLFGRRLIGAASLVGLVA